MNPMTPSPGRQFKAVIETSKYTPKFAVVFSQDGLQWHEADRRPDLPSCEMTSGTKFNGCYYLSGHGGRHFGYFKQAGLAQGQGFENVGDETLFCYAPWPEQLSNGVRVASWQRDPLGYFQASDLKLRSSQPRHVISAPIVLEGQPRRVSLNVDGLSDHGQITVDILNERFEPVEGYSGKDSALLESGLHQAVSWKEHERIEKKDGAFRIRLNYGGIRPEDPMVYAVYVEPAVKP